MARLGDLVAGFAAGFGGQNVGGILAERNRLAEDTRRYEEGRPLRELQIRETRARLAESQRRRQTEGMLAAGVRAWRTGTPAEQVRLSLPPEAALAFDQYMQERQAGQVDLATRNAALRKALAPERPKPMSPIGKLREDVRRGFATPQDLEAQQTAGQSSANVQYLQFVADQVFGGDIPEAFRSIQGGKQKDEATFRRDLAGRIAAANPYMQPEEIQAVVDGAIQAADAVAGQNEPTAQDRTFMERLMGIFGGGGGGGGTQEQQPAATDTLPDRARAQLQEGVPTTFANGQVWTLENGQPKRLR